MHDQTGLVTSAPDIVEQGFAKLMLLKKVTEVQQGCCVRYLLLEEIDPQERTHDIAVVDGVFDAFIGQIEPVLREVHA
nr:hypothetical protein [Pyramidobacter porci]